MELADRQFARREKTRDAERAASGSKTKAPQDPAMPIVEAAQQFRAKQDSPRVPAPVAEVGPSRRQVIGNEPRAAQATASGLKSDGSVLPPRKNAGINRPPSRSGRLDGAKREKVTEPRKTKVSETPAQARSQIQPQMRAESTPTMTRPADGHPSTTGTFPERKPGKHKPSENQTTMESVRKIDNSRPKVAEAERNVASKSSPRQPLVVPPCPHPNPERQSQVVAGLTRQDRDRMKTSPHYLARDREGSFLILSMQVSASLTAAARDAGHRHEFERWHARQEADRQEFSRLFARSEYENRMQMEQAAKAGNADDKLIELLKRWNNTPLITNGIKEGLGIRRKAERDRAEEAERLRVEEERQRNLHRQAALTRQQDTGF